MLLKWSGGKKDEIKNFEQYFPDIYDTYLEPFVGGGSVLFYLQPKKSAVTDVHIELIDFYNAMKDDKGMIIHNFMKEHPNTEIEYYNTRDNLIINTPLDNASRFYYLRKTCFRGMMRYNKSGKFNIPYGRYKTMNYDELLNPIYTNTLKNSDITCNSFEYLFDKYNSNEHFMFLDPPYDSTFTDYGYCSFGKPEHIKLFELFKKTKIKCLMIIGKTQFIQDLYKDYIVDEYAKKYKFKLHSGRVGSEINTTHLIIKNY